MWQVKKFNLFKNLILILARGLDIPAIQNVLNFSVAKDIETHIHRVGRTGRAGKLNYNDKIRAIRTQFLSLILHIF
jgi:superfamily II DNA/RNA helicase